MGVVAIVSQFRLRFSTARTDGKSTRRALVEAAKQVRKDLHSNASVDGAQASATSADNSIPTRDPGTTISRPAVSDSHEHEYLASSAPSRTKDSLKHPDSELEAVYLSPVASPLAITLASSPPAPEPQQEASPHTTHDVDVYGAILHMFESCPELLEDIQEVVEAEEGAAEDAVPSAAATESAAVESADASPEAVSSSGQDGFCVVKVVLPDLCKDAGLVPLGSGSSLSSGFPSSPAGTTASCTSSAPCYLELPSSLSFKLDDTAVTEAPADEEELAAAQQAPASPAPLKPQQHPLLFRLPSSLSLSLSWSDRHHQHSYSSSAASPSAALANAHAGAHTKVYTSSSSGESSMGPGSQAAMEAAWLPAGLISAGGSSVAAGGVVDASPSSSSSSSLPAAPAAAAFASCRRTVALGPQQAPQPSPLIAPSGMLYKLPGDSELVRLLRTQAAALFTPESGKPLGRGAYGTVHGGTVTIHAAASACGGGSITAQVVAKTAAEPDSRFQNRLLLEEGRLMLALQDAGLVGGGCTVRALALSGDPEAGAPVALVLERCRCSLWDVLADCERQPNFQRGTMTLMPWRRVFDVLRAVAAALMASHSLGFVHQDVKPENILVREDGSVALGDFGCAARIPAGGLAYSEDDCGGSPHFAAPEIVRLMPRMGPPPAAWPILTLSERTGVRLPLTRGVDIWSLGVLAVCLMVTGTNEREAALYARGELALPAYVPAALAQLVGDCTQDMGYHRPSAEAVLRRLDAIEQRALAAAEAEAAAAVAATEAAAHAAMGHLAESIVASLCC
ncbi:hypothetical protein HYH02_002898 [Chlamydomonas schloesseri]|uniref:Protein kinase domain-containing protein n=1 Tax=Chlamydomonas schloesseri TaxID=2026947 RepID=A0A835WS47_9CHLO|nr:hypothetical protein HYH02_002898 [Chlamydomonas schloesseri]|eukprot:KAG2452665.1 hypothetical protein HYH02_002898 [Chlamydomonas schloesseri]